MPLACPYITNGLTRYTFYATGETRSVTSHITCNTKNVIYMVQCNCCNLQYIGETKRRLKDRFNKHRRAVDKNNFKSKPITMVAHYYHRKTNWKCLFYLRKLKTYLKKDQNK